MQFSLSGRHLCIPVLFGKSFIDKHFCIHPHKSRFVCSIKFILAAFKLAGGEQHFMLFADGKSTRDRRANVARGAAPCTERIDAKQPGHSGVRAVCLAERTYSRQESIKVRPLFQRDYFMSISPFICSHLIISTPSFVG